LIIYESTKENFLNSVINDTITDDIYTIYQKKLGKSPEAQIRSWTNSMEYMYKVLSDSEIPNNAGVAIEFTIPTTSKRIDFIISGFDEKDSDSVIIIELKQWQSAQKVDKDGIVRTFVGKREREVAHPSYQAWSYASLIEDFNESVQDDKISLYPCAYLHNYKISEDDPISDDFYKEYIDKAPLYGNGDVIKLRDFIKRYIKKGDNERILYKIEHGKIRPSKRLQDVLSGMLKHNEHFVMIDEQKVTYELARQMARDSYIDDKKRVLIVEGGPGTGKSVVAINLLVDLIQDDLVSLYVTKNSAPRNVYFKQLKGNYTQKHINNLFKSSGSFINSQSNEIDAIIVDEAHRLNKKSGLYGNKGENQIKELINAGKFTIFFIDPHQKVHIKDYGSIEEIEKCGREFNAEVKKIKLNSQFRCNGSDGYLSWLDDVLEIEDTANYDGFSYDYDFEVIDNPAELKNLIFEKNKINNKSRLLAGYCWKWETATREDTNVHDIEIDGLSMSWNLKNSTTWAIDENSVNEIGCIHTSQGLEFDYVGVIIGEDMRFENNEIITDFNKRASSDQSLRGIKKMHKENPAKAEKIADEIIKNTYKTLMTRGMKGCYIYCVDKNLQNYFKNRLNSIKSDIS
jgi:uncharacterized protein